MYKQKICLFFSFPQTMYILKLTKSLMRMFFTPLFHCIPDGKYLLWSGGSPCWSLAIAGLQFGSSSKLSVRLTGRRPWIGSLERLGPNGEPTRRPGKWRGHVFIGEGGCDRIGKLWGHTNIRKGWGVKHSCIVAKNG